MQRCWALEPQDRPCFSKLVVFMENELADMEEKVTRPLGCSDTYSECSHLSTSVFRASCTSCFYFQRATLDIILTLVPVVFPLSLSLSLSPFL